MTAIETYFKDEIITKTHLLVSRSVTPQYQIGVELEYQNNLQRK